MAPYEFLAKRPNVDLKEHSASPSHFNDLCRLLGVDDPIAADPKGQWFTFEKGATKTSGGEGWADVWRKGCFAWEYKGRKKDLDKAFAQLLQAPRSSTLRDTPGRAASSGSARSKREQEAMASLRQIRKRRMAGNA